MATKPLPEIVSLKEGLEKELLRQPGVTGVDVGYKYVGGQPTDEIAIRVMVEKKKKSVPEKEKVPATFDGVKTDVIERTYSLHGAKNTRSVSEFELEFDTGSYDPVKGGISIGPCRVIGGLVHAGTLGAIVKDNATSAPLLLSNFHIMCVDGGWKAGDAMAQPSRVDGGTCPASVVGTLVRAQLTDSVDAAVCSLAGRGFSCEIADVGPVTGINTATLGMAVRKRGRTTGLTYGIVDSVSLTVNFDYGTGLGAKTLTNQIGIRPDTARNPAFADHGDSGAVLVDDDGRIIGLHFAGSNDGNGVANPIAGVLAALEVSICTGMAKPGMKDAVDTKQFDTKQFKEVDKEKLEKLEVKEGEKFVLEGNFKPSEGPQIGGVMAGIIPDKNPDKQPPDKPVKSDKEKVEFKENKPEAKELKQEFKEHKPESKEIKNESKNESKELKSERKEQIKEKIEIKEKVEIKERKSEAKELKIEVKEHTKSEFEKPFLENQKQVFEGGGKQIAEGGGKLLEGGDPFQQQLGAQGLQGATGAAQIKQVDKTIEKIKAEHKIEFKDHKNESKEFKVEIKDHKIENKDKVELKDHKSEIKELKGEKDFKIEQKEHGKSEFDVNVPKFFEGGDPFQVNTPVAQGGLQGATGAAQLKHVDKTIIGDKHKPEKEIEKTHVEKNWHKELKDFTKEGIPDKIPFDKPHPDKQIFEGGQKFNEGGDPFRPDIAAGGLQGATGAAALKHVDKIVEKTFSKPEGKDKIEFKDHKNEAKELKNEAKEHKNEFKDHKNEWKEHVKEKPELKEHIKTEFEKPIRDNVKDFGSEGGPKFAEVGDPFQAGSLVAQGGPQGASAEPQQASAGATAAKFPKVEFEKHPKHEIEKVKFEGEKIKFEKELVLDKHKSEFEKTFQEGPKTLVEGGPGFPGQPGPVETRISQLEATVAQLSTFITQGMRPDLGAGALTNEPDQKPEPKPEPKPDPKAAPKGKKPR